MLDQTVRDNKFLDQEEIDLSKILKILFLKKKLIGFITILFLIIGYVFYKTRPPIWEGQFDIVLKNNSVSNKNLNPLQAINSGILSQFIGQSSSGLDLKTEVQILRSQSVLMPIYEFVKKENLKKGIDLSSYPFNSWKNNLLIELQRGTSVLNIQYNDSNKDIIKPVLEAISSEYKKYSAKDRDKGLSNGIEYLEEQKRKLTKESQRSIEELQKFSLENSLGDFDGLFMMNQSTGIGNFEISKSEAAENSKFKNNNITSRYESNFSRLYELESILIQKSTLLKPNAPQIIELKAQIQAIKDNLSRPSEILLKYRNLKRVAMRNELLLTNVEGQLETLKLDFARQEEPWELISNPTVTEQPVSPKVFNILSLSTLLGFVLSSIYVIYMHKSSGIIDDLEELKKIIPFKYIKTFSVLRKKSWHKSVELIKQSIILEKNNDKLGFLNLSSSDSINVEEVVNLLQIENKDFLFSNDLIDLNECNKLILIAESWQLTKEELSFMIEEIKLIKKEILGWIYIG